MPTTSLVRLGLVGAVAGLDGTLWYTHLSVTSIFREQYHTNNGHAVCTVQQLRNGNPERTAYVVVNGGVSSGRVVVQERAHSFYGVQYLLVWFRHSV